MGDTTLNAPDHDCLFATASAQHGYFTAAQAQACGFASPLLAHHLKRGRFRRASRGVYRLKDYPSSPREEVAAAWLALGEEAVVSHASALELHGLSDVIPDAVHFTVPRARRHLPRLPGTRIHTTTRPLAAAEVDVREGIPVTSPARTIADAASAGVGPEQIELAVAEALARGLATPGRLEQAAAGRSRRVRELVARAIEQAGT